MAVRRTGTSTVRRCGPHWGWRAAEKHKLACFCNNFLCDLICYIAEELYFSGIFQISVVLQ